MKASVIIPSYNAEERLYYNLISLDNQDCNYDEFEVIAVDNGSIDNTFQMLKNFKSKYSLKYVRLDNNRGIARGRNAAIKHATGDILIFHDSDMIAPKDFISKHLKAHEENDVVVCGIGWKRIYSYYYKDFWPDVMNKFESIRGLYNLEGAYPLKDKYKLLSENSIIDGSYMKYTFDLKNDFTDSFNSVINQYGSNFKQYNIPWRFFFTNNASVERSKVIDVGMFDEKIVGYGYEDYDLGIRLYKSGCKFVLGHDIISVHQEHPSNAIYSELSNNNIYMCDKYNNIYFIDMVLICIIDKTSINKECLSELMGDINKMVYLESFKWILELFLEFLQVVRKYHYQLNERYKISKVPNIEKKFGYVAKEASMLKEKFELTYFADALLALINDVKSISL